MENEIHNTHEENHLCFDQNAKRQLVGVKKWAQIISVIGFIFMAIMVLISITTISAKLLPEFGEVSNLRIALLPIVGIFYLLILTFYFFIFYYLFRFSALAGRAINTNETEYLTRSLSFLRKHYLLIVVFTIVYIVFAIILGIVTFSIAMKEFGTLS
jgi:hypothetical protein